MGFDVAAVAGNGNGASSGDSPGFQRFQWVFGCTGRSFYLDLDRDGFGAKALGARLACLGEPAPEGFAAEDGDCDENDEKVHPGATEVCNKKDDDCNGEVDEGAPPVQMWPDADGDGYYAQQSGTPKTGCGNVPLYAALGGDCDDLDAAVHPRAEEACNNRDDNCDGDVDEKARPQCGVGWCARYSSSCDVADCRPGPPDVEKCNAFDDDCDGVIDNDACAAGFVCSSGQCLAIAEVTPGAPPAPAVTAGPSALPTAAPTAARKPAAGCAVSAGATPTTAPWLISALILAAGTAQRRRRRSSEQA